MERNSCIKGLWITGLIPAGLHARPSALTPGRSAFRITGLTSATRDALAQDLALDGGFRIAFACVPAGILVVESTSGPMRQADTDRLLPMLQNRSNQADVIPLALNAADWEAECETARNQ
ncbi:MAG: hypothetical protein IPK99_06710 [Flavobacteriales bacterium]|nr:hypothetical protein [Flavobacteriales bacterium]